MKIISFLFGLLSFFATNCWGQDYSFRAPLPAVPETGFYKIILTPEIAGQTKPDFSDLRLYDRKKREVPYLIHRAEASQTQRFFREYPIVEKMIRHGVNTTLVIRNQNQNKIDNIGLLIKNTNVTKMARLSGSSNGQNWYALEDNYVLQSVANSRETSEVKVLHFPLSDYEFYRLEIKDSTSAPLNILAAGYYDFTAESGEYSQLDRLTISRTDSAELKSTFFKVSFAHPVLIDKLEFKVDSATFYRRNATVFVWKTEYHKRRRKSQKILVPLHAFILSSDTKNNVNLTEFRVKEFYVVIENADNPPLPDIELAAFQLNTYMIAEVKKKKEYELRFGNVKATKPVYDLAYFKEKIPGNLPVLIPGQEVQLTLEDKNKTSINQFFQTKMLIWAAIIGVILLLGFTTFQMLKEGGETNK